jgi:voltage-gated sodium channel
MKWRTWVHSRSFHFLITGLILLACVVVGLETHEPFAHQYGNGFALINTLILTLFVLEMLLRIASDGRRFFRDGWNWFDLIVVSICLLPAVGQYVLLFRLFRAVRAIRLVEAFSRLRVVVITLLDSLPSIGYVLLLMFIHLYVYGVIGYFLFGNNDPLHFRNLPTALLALFQVATLEGWAEIFYINYYGCASTYTTMGQGWCVASQAQPLIAALYFLSFVVIGAFIIVNLFIGVVLNGILQAQATEKATVPSLTVPSH